MATVYRDARGRFASREAFTESRALAREAGVTPTVRIEIVSYAHEHKRQGELDATAAAALGYDVSDYTDDSDSDEGDTVEYDFDNNPY